MSQFVQVITRQELLEEAKKTKFYFFNGRKFCQ